MDWTSKDVAIEKIGWVYYEVTKVFIKNFNANGQRKTEEDSGRAPGSYLFLSNQRLLEAPVELFI
jgi:hypothetical protein